MWLPPLPATHFHLKERGFGFTFAAVIGVEKSVIVGGGWHTHITLIEQIGAIEEIPVLVHVVAIVVFVEEHGVGFFGHFAVARKTKTKSNKQADERDNFGVGRHGMPFWEKG